MNGTLKRHGQIWSILVGLLFALPMVAWALSTATVTVTVTALALPACVINDDRPIEVEFGDVMTTRVDGNNYRKRVGYNLSCKGGAHNAMKLQVQGNGASFDSSLLKTNKAGLGIELQQGNSKLGINTWLKFFYPNKPELWAMPVKQGGATLAGGKFNASATMMVDYQ